MLTGKISSVQPHSGFTGQHCRRGGRASGLRSPVRQRSVAELFGTGKISSINRRSRSMFCDPAAHVVSTGHVCRHSVRGFLCVVLAPQWGAPRHPLRGGRWTFPSPEGRPGRRSRSTWKPTESSPPSRGGGRQYPAVHRGSEESATKCSVCAMCASSGVCQCRVLLRVARPKAAHIGLMCARCTHAQVLRRW